MKLKEESEKAGLKQHSETKIMASGPITSCQIDGKTMETVTEFIWRGGPPKSLQMVTVAMNLRHLPLEEKL